MKYNVLTTKRSVIPEGEKIFSERATHISVSDEAGGLFVVVEQSRDDEDQSIRIDDDEWPLIRKEIDEMVKTCIDYNKKDVK